MNLGVQYYRAPFPNRRYWADDFAKIRDCGLDTVQLWVLWSWVESRPGEFAYDDYDELVGLAGKNGLNVVLSTIAEIQPVWIHRVIPDCELVGHDGSRIVSVHRGETHFGLTPGGCTDHPEVWAHMARFLEETVKHYRGTKHLLGWDAWNELRWAVGKEQYNVKACFCPHTVAAFRKWLDEKYGGLDALNRAWQRRYVSWEDVQPGRTREEPYTHSMAFSHFMTERASRHGIARYKVMKALDPARPVTAHGPCPCMEIAGGKHTLPLERGNDWQLADVLDGVGTSSFPKWGVNVKSNWANFVDRIEVVRSAAQGKQLWLSEVQGGRASIGFTLYDPVEPSDQQHWVWIGQSCGADVLLFWCWRDEVFGRESNGFGMSGADGFASERMDAMRVSAKVMQENKNLLRSFRPDMGEVGVWFSPQAFYLSGAYEDSAGRILEGLRAWGAAFTRASVAYRTIEEEHLDALAGLKLLVLPRAIVLDGVKEQALEKWVREGGTLVCESEAGAFDPVGVYRYAGDRWLARLTGAVETGRRRGTDPSLKVTVPGQGRCELHVGQWQTPMTPVGKVWAKSGEGAMIQEVVVGKGRVILCGCYLGTLPEKSKNPKVQKDQFAAFVDSLVAYAGVARPACFVAPAVKGDLFPYLRHGKSGARNLLFCFASGGKMPVKLRLGEGVFAEGKVRDLLTGRTAKVSKQRTLEYKPGPWGIAVLVGE